MLIERWHPVTSDLGLINAPLQECVDSFTAWHNSIGFQYTSRLASTFAMAFEMLLPLSAEMRRRVFVPTAASGWTALFQSGISGSDPFPATNMLAAKLLKVLGMRVCAPPPKATYPAVIWEVYAPPTLGGNSPLGFRRSIAAMNDGGRWIFEQSAEPYPFEQLVKYSLPSKRDRFTRELLVDYVAQFGLAPLSDSFYPVSGNAPAIVLERISRWDNVPPEFTLDQVQAGMPWRRI